MNGEPPPRRVGSSHGSLPPPSDNPGVGAWYRAGRALDECRRIEGDLEGSIQRLGGELSKRIRELELKNRRSGHELREVKEWQEDSEVRDMRRELAQAKEILKAREVNARAQSKRAWDLFKAILLLLVGGLVTWWFGGHPVVVPH
jgi:hypothetical protein